MLDRIFKRKIKNEPIEEQIELQRKKGRAMYE